VSAAVEKRCSSRRTLKILQPTPHSSRRTHRRGICGAVGERTPARLMHCKGRGRLRADRSVSPVPSLSARLSWESTLSLGHSRSTVHRQFKEPFSLHPRFLPARRPRIRNDVPSIINQVESAQLGARNATGFIHMIMMTGGKEKITQWGKERKEAADQSAKHAANLCVRRGAVAPTDLCALYEQCTGGRTKKEASARCNAAPRSPDKIVPPVSRPAAAANRWVTLGRNGGPPCPNRVGPVRQCTALHWVVFPHQQDVGSAPKRTHKLIIQEAAGHKLRNDLFASVGFNFAM
jgi:hypothetical protein